MAEDVWYYGKDGNQIGPVTAETLRRMLATGQLIPADPVWQDGMTAWVAAASVPALAGGAPRAAGPPPLPHGATAPPAPLAGAWPQAPAPGGPRQAWPPVGYYRHHPSAAPDPARKKAESAAKASWCAVLVAIVLNVAANAGRTGRRPDRSELLVVGLASLAIYLFGLSCGIYALTQVRKYGPQGIRTPAIVGIVLNALIVAAFVAVIIAAGARN
jgi:GYF domain 2